MLHKRQFREALAGRVRRNRLLAVAVVTVAVYFLLLSAVRPKHSLRMSAGDVLSHRHELALILSEEAGKHRLDIDVHATAGSKKALELLAAGELDVAFVQGDVAIDSPNVRQVAALLGEPLHLFVKPELAGHGLAALKGKRINVGARESGTRIVAQETLAFVGLRAGTDYEDVALSYEELLATPTATLPDGIFAMTALPWKEMGDALVKQHGYRLLELPFGEAMALRNGVLHDMVIPAYSYSVDPPVPDAPMHTVSARLLAVAHKDVPAGAIERLLQVLFESDFALHAELPTLDPADIVAVRQFPLHPGAIKYLHRNDPLLANDLIDRAENLRSFLVSAGLATFLLWRWRSRRRLIGFETYIDSATELELEALDLERHGTLDSSRLLALRRRLSELKSEALEKHAEGVLKGEDQMAGFLLHVADVRSYLESLFAHESRQQAAIAEAAADAATVDSPAAATATDVPLAGGGDIGDDGHDASVSTK